MNNNNRGEAIRRHLENLVADGAPGDVLPPVRALSETLSASPVTIVRAVSDLASRGLLYTEPGRGTFIAKRATKGTLDMSWQPVALAPARVDHLAVAPLDPGASHAAATPLSHGYLGDELQPRQFLQAAASRTVRRAEIWAPAPAAGLVSLRAIFAAQLDIDPTQILITRGSQSALALIFQTIAAPGDTVLVENPTYPGALAAARAAGLRPVPVPTDQQGVRPDYFDDLLARTGARLAYLQTAVNNPSGISLAPQRRREILASATARGVIIIDDDWARHLSLGEPVPQPLIVDDADGHVIHVSSLAKSVAPSLRIGFLVARGPALQRLHTASIVTGLFIGRPLQEIAFELLASPDWARHLRQLTRTLTRRRDHLRAELARYWPATEQPIRLPSAGYHLWVPCPPGITSTELTRRARQEGIIVGDGALSFADEAPTQHVRLSFGAATETAMTQSVARLAALIED